MEEKQLYAVDRLEQAKRTILLAKEEMPAARKKLKSSRKETPMERRTGTKRCKVSRLACWMLRCWASESHGEMAHKRYPACSGRCRMQTRYRS